MRTILVLTDFSNKATCAAEVALSMAVKLNANLLLFHAFTVEVALPYAETGPWTEEVYSLQEQETQKGLSQLKAHLETLIKRLPEGQRRPVVQTLGVPDGLGDQLRELANEKNLEMIVMGARKDSVFEHFMFGSETATVINHSTVPVLIIPESTRLNSIQKIVYATDFDPNDLTAIRYLAKIACAFEARLEITHIELYGENQQEKLAEQISLIEDLAQLKYRDIAYKGVKGKDTLTRLENLCAEEKPELLAMLHHQRSFLEGLLKKSETHKVLLHQKLPLLVFPDCLQA